MRIASLSVVALLALSPSPGPQAAEPSSCAVKSRPLQLKQHRSWRDIAQTIRAPAAGRRDLRSEAVARRFVCGFSSDKHGACAHVMSDGNVWTPAAVVTLRGSKRRVVVMPHQTIARDSPMCMPEADIQVERWGDLVAIRSEAAENLSVSVNADTGERCTRDSDGPCESDCALQPRVERVTVVHARTGAAMELVGAGGLPAPEVVGSELTFPGCAPIRVK